MRLLLLVLFFLVAAVQAGSKESQACNICRKEKEPTSKKFPDGISSCSDGFYPSATCPVVQTDGADDPNNDPHADCHTDPYSQECGKKKSKHPQKHNSTKKQDSHSSIVSGVLFLGVMALVAMIFACFMILALESRNKTSQMYNIEYTENI